MEKLFTYESTVNHGPSQTYNNCVLLRGMSIFPKSTKLVSIKAIRYLSYISLRRNEDEFAYCVDYNFETEPFLKRKLN